MFYDVVIMGSGPAACASALYCNMMGLSTVMVTSTKQDDEQFLIASKGLRPCESVHYGIIPILSRLNAIAVLQFSKIGRYSQIISPQQTFGYHLINQRELGGIHID